MRRLFQVIIFVLWIGLNRFLSFLLKREEVLRSFDPCMSIHVPDIGERFVILEALEEDDIQITVKVTVSSIRPLIQKEVQETLYYETRNRVVFGENAVEEISWQFNFLKCMPCSLNMEYFREYMINEIQRRAITTGDVIDVITN